MAVTGSPPENGTATVRTATYPSIEVAVSSGVVVAEMCLKGVITGVADRLPERIASLVYVDAFVPQDGQAWWDLAGDANSTG